MILLDERSALCAPRRCNGFVERPPVRTRPGVWLPRRRPCIWTPPRNAIALDANLGTSNAAHSGLATFTQTHTTTAAAAAGATTFLLLSYWTDSAGSLPDTVTDSGGGAWTRDQRVSNGSDRFDMWRCYQPGGLVSGATIGVHFPVAAGPFGVGGILIGVVSFTGIDISSPFVTSTSANSTGTGWSSGAATNTGFADALFLGGSGNETAAAATSTPVNGTEIHDARNASAQQGFATGYTIASTVASRSISGTFSSASTASTAGLVIYAAASADVMPMLVMAPRIPSY